VAEDIPVSGGPRPTGDGAHHFDDERRSGRVIAPFIVERRRIGR